MERFNHKAPTAPQPVPWTRVAGSEPVPGYRLLEPLGRGGFGEVWKCQAPGGLHKAVKFVADGDSGTCPAVQELEALQRVIAIRHPFILSLDRVEVVDGVLVIIMELADRNLHAACGEYRSRGRDGIPREELLRLLLEAAEALDWMNFEHGLQHLDIKPHNLFVVSNHLKVADFGLVDDLKDEDSGSASPRRGGMTPIYAAPEILRGAVSRQSDQYSLAIVYQQLLTGTIPFWSPNVYQLMMQHLVGEPDLEPLPEADRPAVARALSKQPDQRFPSCLEFIQTLLAGSRPAPPRSGARPRLAPNDGEEERPTKQVRRPTTAQTPCADDEAARTRCVAGLDDPTPPAETPRPRSRPETVADDAAGPAAYPPTCVSLPGYQFLRCTGQSPLGDLWLVRDEAGRQRRALCLYNFAGEDDGLVARLRELSHPSLPPADAFWSPAGRLVVVGDRAAQTLRDRFEVCQAEGLLGVPRAELLGYLRSAAEALDELYGDLGLQHLGLNPRNLLVDGGRAWLADFGLVSLVWLPTGQSAGQLNGRYAPPELFDRRVSPSADQYSLALVYAEMLTGFHPRPTRNSALHRRPGGAPPRVAGARSAGRVDLDLLPATDRDVMARALHADPRQRFASCVEFVAALEAAALAPASADHMYRTLPPVIPFATLQGEPVGLDRVLPSVGDLVQGLNREGDPHIVLGPQNVRYTVLSGGAWECRYPVRLFPGALRLRVEDFRRQWQARIVEEDQDAFVFHIDLDVPRGFWDRCRKVEPPRLEILLWAQAGRGGDNRLSEAHVRLVPKGGKGGETAQRLEKMAPELFESLRGYLQASPEQRGDDRWPCPLPLHVYPVLPGLKLAEVLEGRGQDISPGGVSFRVSRPPASEWLYLHWHQSPTAGPCALLARVVRVQPVGADGYEVGAAFLVPETA